MAEVKPLPILQPFQNAVSKADRRALVERLFVWVLSAALTLYLALSGGGYDILVRSEIGLLVWWLVLLGMVTALLPRAAMPRAGWIVAGLLAGFLVWSWIGLSWSSSHELTLDTVCQVSTYLGVLLLGVCLVTHDTARPLLYGLAFGITVVSTLGVLSKLTPSLFPANAYAQFYETARLSYPFDYADGVGEFAALGIPLLLWASTSSRTLVARSLAGAALPVVLLCLAMTVSRGGILAAVIGLVFFFALAPDRLPRLASLAISAVATTVLMVALLHRPALRDSLAVAPASERHSMLLLLIVVVAACFATQAAFTVSSRRLSRPAALRISREGARRTAIAIAAVCVLAVVIAFATGTASHIWHDFKQVNAATNSNQYFRLLSLAGSHRYQYWQVAIKAFDSAPLTGIGPGTYRFFWAQHQTIGEYVQNAHSLWFETLAETGLVGLILLGGFFGFTLVGGSRRALRIADAELRAVVATAVAGVAAFCAGAAFDWVWQIGVIPIVTMLLIAVVVSGEREQAAASGPQPTSPRWVRSLLAIGAVPAIIVIVIPLASTIAVRDSETAAQKNQLTVALRDANIAASIEPGAASPRLQQALVLEKLGDVRDALTDILAAVAREPRSSELWLTASRIETENGKPTMALADYETAKRLDPLNTIFEG